MDINAYNAATSVQKQSNVAGATAKKDGSKLEMQDFLNLMTAQLSNQDAMNPSTDTEFIAQMAQFSSLQAMQTLTELTYAQYGSSMVGKTVIVATTDKRGNLVEDTGEVTNAKFLGGAVTITVNDKEYDMSAIMGVLKKAEPKTEPDKADTPETEKPVEAKTV